MSASQLVTVILPTYNEVQNIIPLVEWIERELIEVAHETLVVDDDSPDGTSEAVIAAQRTNPNLRIIIRKQDHGLAASIREGLAQARGSICIWMDADLSMSPVLLPRFIQKIERGSDLVLGSRYIPGGGMKGVALHQAKTRAWDIIKNIHYSEDSLLSALISKCGNVLLRFILHPSVHDYSSGYFGGRREFLCTHLPVGGSVDYCITLPYKAIVDGFKVTEIPMMLATRVHGVSKTSETLVSILSIAARCFRKAVWLRLTYRPRGDAPGSVRS